MSVFSNIKNYFSGDSRTITKLSAELDNRGELHNKQSLATAVKKRKRPPISRALKRRNYRIEPDLRKLRQALQAAEDPNTYDRELLYLLYHRVMEHEAVLTQVRNARFTVQMSDFEIRVNKEHSEDLTELFDKPWFFKFVQYAVDTELYGHSLIELQSGDDGMIDKCFLVPREFVRPEDQLLMVRPGRHTEGLIYTEAPLANHVVSLGEDDDIGLLSKIAKAAIRSDYGMSDWGNKNERFGSPLIVMKTASRDKKELDEKAQMLENFGTNSWAITDDEDEIILKEPMSNTGGGHKAFDDFVDRNDKYIAMLINGQTSTTEQTAYVGAAEVQERVQDKFTLARLRRIQYAINYNLIPFLVKHRDYPLANAKFTFLDLEKNEEDGNEMKTQNKDTGEEE